MSNTVSRPIFPLAARTDAYLWLRNAGLILASSLFLAVCARIAVPLWFTPVPLTVQPFGVLVLGLLLGPQMTAAAVIGYLAEGALGLPVFSPGAAATTGLLHLFGPTGGYLLAYPLAGVITSVLWRRTSRGFTGALVSAAAGDLLVLFFGALWLAASTHAAISVVISGSVLAFLPGDAIKVAAAAGIAVSWRRVFRRAR